MCKSDDLSEHCILSIDVEDWFHILDVPSSPRMADWCNLPSHVERDFRRLLAILAEANVQATCFFLGWVAERFPHLVREAVSAGHEIASHGFGHELVYRQSAKEFTDDICRSKATLEDISGRGVFGYRAPGFSVTQRTPWFYDRLVAAGYEYSSSVFPAPRGHGGMPHARLAPHCPEDGDGEIVEFPISVTRVLGRRLCLFGGGYLRLFPYHLIRHGVANVLADGRPTIFYVHPREINPEQRRLSMSAIRRFKSYVNLRSTEPKLRRLLRDFKITTFGNYLNAHFEIHEAYRWQPKQQTSSTHTPTTSTPSTAHGTQQPTG